MKWILLLFLNMLIVSASAQTEVRKDSIAVLFPHNNAVIDDVEILQTALNKITGPVSKIVLVGYTDSVGKVSDNRLLASKRINSVLVLLQKSKWKAVKIETVNANETSGFQHSNLALNRRVDVLIFAKSEEKPLSVELDKPINLNINFENSKAIVLEESLPNMKKLLDIMLADSTLNVRLNGHVCCQSAHELSFERANTVLIYLNKHGVARSRLYAQGFSNTKPLVPDVSQENHAINRRVEAIFSRKK
jgi:outer membrane protein OmpA-like peptidoglycan-associated protein